MTNSGQIYVFTGNGKGKTSAALGVGVRAALSGMHVAMVQWYKDPAWQISEHHLHEFIPHFQIYPLGKGFYFADQTKTKPLSNKSIIVDKADQVTHQTAAIEALTFAQRLLPQVDLLILDELNNALHEHLVDLDPVIDLINQRGHTHLILTGRDAHPAIIDLAHLVTQMDKVKHPYDSGTLAIKGLDF